MLDILLSRLKEEIAIDGEEGVDITTVWEYTTNILKELTKSVSQKEPTIDDKYKAFLWPHLKRLDSLTFYKREPSNNEVATKPTVKAPAKSTQKGKRKKKQVVLDQEYIEDIDSEEEEEEEEEEENKNEHMSIVTKDVKCTKIEVKDMDYHQLTQDYGDNISVIASKEFQEKQIYKNVPPVVFPAPKQIEAIQAIIRQRSKGIYQTDLAKALDIDPKSASHYAKTLEEKGAIFRVPISIKGTHTNLCTHVRFRKDIELDYANDSDQKPYNVNIKGEIITSEKILETVIALGKGASNNMLVTRDILYALGFESNSRAVKKWFNRSVEELAIKGYVKKSYTQLDNKGLLVTCVEVLKPAFELNDVSKEQQELIKVRHPLMIEGAKENGPGFCMDTTIHHQIFKMIEDSGVNGCSNREFGLFLNCDARRLIFKYLERLIDNSSDLYPSLIIKRHFEFQGRRKQFRFFTLENYNTLVEKKETEIIPFPETEWSENTLKEFNVLKPVVRTRKHLVSTNHDYVSSYYKNVLANKRKNRPTDEEPQPNHLSASEERPTKKTSRATKNTRNKKHDNEAAQSDIVTVSTIEKQQPPKDIRSPSPENSKKDEAGNETAQVNASTSEQQPAKKKGRTPRKSKKDNMNKEDSHSSVSSISNKTAENMDIEMANETSTSSQPEMITIEETLTSSNLEDNIAYLSKEKIEHSQPIKQSKKQTKKADKKQKSVINKRTLVDYFVKVSKKQKTTSTTDTTEATTTSSTSINKITSECDESITNVDSVTQTDDIVTDLTENEDVSFVTYKKNKEIPAYDSGIVVAEAGPSLMNIPLLTQQSSTNITKVNDLANPTQADASTLTLKGSASINTHISDYIDPSTITSRTAGDSTNKPELADMNTVTDIVISTDNSNKATSLSTPLTPVATAINQSRKRGNVNSYSELRKMILLDVVDQHEIVEVGKDLRRMFEEAHKRIVGKKLPGTVCLKTLWKTCLDLSKNGDAQTKIVECMMLNGKKLTRKVLVRKDIDLEGEKFNEHVDLIRTTRTVMKPHVPASKLERYEAPIERLQDRISKMKEEILEKSDISQPETFKMVAKLSEYADNASNSVTGQIFFKHGRDAEPKRSFWMITCMNHGWLYGRMLRVKCLYHYLFDLLNRPVRIQGVEKEKRTLSLQSIVYNLPCSVFCQIIIIPRWTDELKAYVDNPDNANKTYEDFPPYVREVFFSYSSHFTKTLRTTMSMLVFLGLVIPRGLNSDRDQLSYFSETYELASLAQIWDFRLKPEFTHKDSYNLTTEDDVNKYWKDLHYVAVQSLPQNNDKLAEYSDSLTKESLKSIFTLRNWDNIAILTKTQRSILSSYVNKYKNYTPICNLALCRKISEEAGVSVNAVRNYYSKIQVMLDKKLESRNARRIAREANGNTVIMRNRKLPLSKKYRVNGGYRMINQQTKHIFGALEKRVLVPTKGSKHGDQEKLETNETLFMDNMNHIPVVDGGADLTYKRSKRLTWTKQEEDLLLYCYVILQHRAAYNRFMWYAIRQVLPDKGTSTCRSRISRILMKPSNQEYMSKCKALWKNVYTQGIENGDIVDENRSEMANFDLISQLEYFLKRIKSDLDVDDKISPLPASVSLLNDLYHVHNTSFRERFFHEISYHKKVSSISRMQYMYGLSYSIRSGLDSILDYPSSDLRLEDDLSGREIKLIMSYCMMILMTPQEKYDPFMTYRSLASFDEELFRRAVNNLYNSGITVTTRASRVLPGTKHNLSAKFLQKMANIYPKFMFEQSKEYEKYLAQAGHIQINPHVLSSGMMSCILDLVSRNKLDITMVDNEEQRARIEFSNLARLISRDLTSFDLSIKATDNLDQPKPTDIIEKPYVYPLESATFEKLVSALLLSLEQDKKQLAKNVIAYMKERGSLGSVAYELREHFKNYTEANIQYCLDNLLQAEPPLLCLVGMDSERYVLTISKYIKSWTIFRDTSNSPKKTDQPALFQHLIAIIPALWIDVEGDITPLLFNDCCQTVIGWIISKPGITASGLHRFLQNLIPRVELNRVLKHLVEQKVVKVVTVCQETNGKTGLFSKTRLSQVTKSAKFRRNVETSYFALPGYYNTLTQ